MRPERHDQTATRRSRLSGRWRKVDEANAERARAPPESDDRRCPQRTGDRADDAALITALNARSADAIEHAYDRHADALYGLAVLVADDEHFAQNAVADALLALWKDPSAVLANTYGVHAALAGATYARCIGQSAGDARRRGRWRISRTRATQEPDAGSPLASLPRPQRDLLALIVLGNHTSCQAADRVGLPEGHAATLISRALHTIRDTHPDARELARRPEHLQDALTSRVDIEHAQGILAQRAGVDTNTALELLHAQAHAQHRRLSDIARDVIDGGPDGAALANPRLGAFTQQRSAPDLRER